MKNGSEKQAQVQISTPEQGGDRPSHANLVQFKQELSRCSYDEQLAMIQPEMPVQPPAPAVQLMVGKAVQFAPVKRHDDINAKISEAEMGPYKYVAEAKKFIAQRNELSALSAADLWAACLETTSYKPETEEIEGITKGDKARRVTDARKALLGGVSDDGFKKIIAHDNGNSPRPLVSAVDEHDKCGDAHCHDRHVWGAGGAVNDIVGLAGRACWHVPCATGDDGIASAFTTVAASTAALTTGVANGLTADWENVRVKIAKGSGLDTATVPLAGNVKALQKTDAPESTAYDASEKPTYRGGDGYRPLYPGEPEWDEAKAAASEAENAKYTDAKKANPLTKDVTGTLADIVVVFRADAAVDGGWYVLTCYPKC